MARKKKIVMPRPAPAWMATFTDLMSLLMCFFILIMSMMTIDPAKFNTVAASFQNAFSGVLESFPQVLITKDVYIPKMGGDQQNKRMAIDAAQKVKEVVKKEDMGEAIKVQVTESGIAIKLADPVAFESGSADVNPKLYGVLADIAKIINEAPTSQVRVEGHTDNVPIRNARFPSNWELSSARALNIVRQMANTGGVDPGRMSAIGYGEYRPIVPNTTPENRKQNRRIEIYVDYVQKLGQETGAFTISTD
ncbi:MAG: flagellar motor protein MotB [Chitinispirillia bacterium]|nr:flagellar motor protein MotB [Chitinispirillia bacterium]MCL2268641.1 flagellar motor protein MotB [Chitinispirillia bacterium]